MIKEQFFFLLGGADLEMQTIREILLREEISFADHHLRWDNALLSSYRKELQEVKEGQTVYGIELREDILPPACYQAIDHHNGLSYMPCALEQVMEILQLPMNRYEQLVSGNDKAYISGMLALGATSEEIATIRLADRKAQGVTDEEEQLAEKAIADNQEFVCDRLFPFHKLLIYTDTEWMYYGKRADEVRSLFFKEFDDGNLFYGGGEQGYVGIKQNIYNKDEILEMVNRIKNL